jgi:hypothetical protein
MLNEYYEEYLEEFETINDNIKTSNRLNRYARKQVDKQKLKKLRSVYYDEHKGRYIKCYWSSRSKDAKRFSNRKVRHTKDIGTGNNYRKYWQYEWYVY